jgi:hypothetical protein
MVIDRLVLLERVRVQRPPVGPLVRVDADHVLGDEQFVIAGLLYLAGPLTEHVGIAAQIRLG